MKSRNDHPLGILAASEEALVDAFLDRLEPFLARLLAFYGDEDASSLIIREQFLRGPASISETDSATKRTTLPDGAELYELWREIGPMVMRILSSSVAMLKRPKEPCEPSLSKQD